MLMILNPGLSDQDVEKKIDAWREIITSRSGELVRISRWGKRTLAYAVKKFHQGIFLLMHVKGAHDIPDELERQFKISEDVLRFQTVKLNDLQLKLSRSAIEKMETMYRPPVEEKTEEKPAEEEPVKQVKKETTEVSEIPESKPEETSEPDTEEKGEPTETIVEEK